MYLKYFGHNIGLATPAGTGLNSPITPDNNNAGTTKVNYDEMRAIIKSLQGEEEGIKTLLSQTKSKVEALHNNQWIGQGADKFFDEMESVVLPKMGKLLTALDVAGHVANQIIQTIHQADQETTSFFRAGDADSQAIGDSRPNGLNDIARELLWSEYPTDQRSTTYHQFWDTSESNPDPTQTDK